VVLAEALPEGTVVAQGRPVIRLRTPDTLPSEVVPFAASGDTAPGSDASSVDGSRPDGCNALMQQRAAHQLGVPELETVPLVGGASDLQPSELQPSELQAAAEWRPSELEGAAASALAAAAAALAAARSRGGAARGGASSPAAPSVAAPAGATLASGEPTAPAIAMAAVSAAEQSVWDQSVGSRAGLLDTVQRAQLLAGVDVTLLLEGETGVGKEVFARAIHANGPRRQAPFVSLNCGGLSRDLLVSELFGYVEGAFTGARRAGGIGRIESAQGGTLFLDEIAELPLDLQPYLLRVLEGGEVYPVGGNKPRPVKFRLISACNRTLRHQVIAGRFRMDLFYRLSVTTLEVPPLRHRLEDLPALIEHFALEVAARHGLARKRFSDEALAALGQYSWPGNVRELRNLIESMLLLTPGDVVGLESIPADVLGTETAEDFMKTGIRQAVRPDLEAVEREAISSAIRARRGNLTQVARDLRISRSTLYLKLKKHRLDLLLNQVRLNY
jgi:DNA-binding NtrC family response regulator